jgi:uroporphyrinogen decarboxylase
MREKSLHVLTKNAYDQGRRLVVPLMGFPGVEYIHSNIKLAQQNSREHYKAVKKLVELFSPDAIFPLMDLAVEANAVGRYVIFPKEDSATVPKDSFSVKDLDRLREINIVFDSRLMGYVETIKLMKIGLPENIVKGAYVIGPYSLAALLMGADDAAMASVLDPGTLHQVCDFTTEVIQQYARLLISAGAELICILEPSAVMLGPDQFYEFSAAYVKYINDSCKYSGVNSVYHTCGNSMHLVDQMVKSGVNGLSLDSDDVGVRFDVLAKRLPPDIVLIGNINPASTMLFGKPQDITRAVYTLLDKMKPYPNFILSTGCDLPQETPEENIRAFMDAGRKYKM